MSKLSTIKMSAISIFASLCVTSAAHAATYTFSPLEQHYTCTQAYFLGTYGDTTCTGYYFVRVIKYPNSQSQTTIVAPTIVIKTSSMASNYLSSVKSALDTSIAKFTNDLVAVTKAKYPGSYEVYVTGSAVQVNYTYYKVAKKGTVIVNAIHKTY